MSVLLVPGGRLHRWSVAAAVDLAVAAAAFRLADDARTVADPAGAIAAGAVAAAVAAGAVAAAAVAAAAVGLALAAAGAGAAAAVAAGAVAAAADARRRRPSSTSTAEVGRATRAKPSGRTRWLA